MQVASTKVRGFADDVKSGKATQEIIEGAEKVGQRIVSINLSEKFRTCRIM